MINLFNKLTAFFFGKRDEKLILNPYSKKLQSNQFVPSQLKYSIKIDKSPKKVVDLTEEEEKKKIKPKNSLKQIQIEQNTQMQQQYQNQIIEAENFISQVIQMENNSKQVEKLMIKLQARKQQLTQQQIKRKENISSQSNQMIDQNQSSSQAQQPNNFIEDYKKDIFQVLERKYKGQRIDFPQLSFDHYANIRNLWNKGRANPNQIIKQMKTLKMIQKLTLKTLATLNFRSWLNDQVINGYLQLMQNQIGQNTNIKICNSFFAVTTLAKSPDMIERALKKKKITNKDVILIALNNGNHWFFTKIKDGRVYVYDSIGHQSTYYFQMQVNNHYIFQNIVKFANWFYNKDHYIEVSQNYPQQNNNHDCGMFLLCGIKDALRNYNEWSFSQFDIRYKRILFAKEIINQQISGFAKHL